MACGEAYTDHRLVFCREDGNPLSPGNITELFHTLTDTVRMPEGAKVAAGQAARPPPVKHR